MWKVFRSHVTTKLSEFCRGHMVARVLNGEPHDHRPCTVTKQIGPPMRRSLDLNNVQEAGRYPFAMT